MHEMIHGTLMAHLEHEYLAAATAARTRRSLARTDEQAGPPAPARAVASPRVSPRHLRTGTDRP